MKVIIKSIERQYVMDDDEYQFVKDNLNQSFTVQYIGLDNDGTVRALGMSIGDTVVTVFVGRPGDLSCSNGIKYELIGELLMSN